MIFSWHKCVAIQGPSRDFDRCTSRSENGIFYDVSFYDPHENVCDVPNEALHS